MPRFDVVRSAVAGVMEALWEFPSALHDCFARSEPRAHCFDSMVGQWSPLARKAIEPLALHVEGRTGRGRRRGCSAACARGSCRASPWWLLASMARAQTFWTPVMRVSE
jgi:hypothetical protein